MLRTISLSVVLFLFWLALSDHHSILLVMIGVGVVVVCTAITTNVSGHSLTLRALTGDGVVDLEGGDRDGTAIGSEGQS